jgi:hypothetical protein
MRETMRKDIVRGMSWKFTRKRPAWHRRLQFWLPVTELGVLCPTLPPPASPSFSLQMPFAVVRWFNTHACSCAVCSLYRDTACQGLRTSFAPKVLAAPDIISVAQIHGPVMMMPHGRHPGVFVPSIFGALVGYQYAF